MMRAYSIAAVFALTVGPRAGAAQDQPAVVPTVVARAMSIQSSMFGTPHYLVGSVPPDWPAALMPENAKVIGGGWLGDTDTFRMRTAVFELVLATDPTAQLNRLVARAGYTRSPSSAQPSSGFVQGSQAVLFGGYCNGSTMVVSETMETTPVAIVALHLIDGENGRQNCAPGRSMQPSRFPVTLPTLAPPTGAMAFGVGSSWSSAEGEARESLRTTLGADSILFHFTAELVEGGWKLDGQPALGTGVASQRFLFREGRERWTAALLVFVVGDKREVRIDVSKLD